jgi:hypothetical protein
LCVSHDTNVQKLWAKAGHRSDGAVEHDQWQGGANKAVIRLARIIPANGVMVKPSTTAPCCASSERRNALTWTLLSIFFTSSGPPLLKALQQWLGHTDLASTMRHLRAALELVFGRRWKLSGSYGPDPAAMPEPKLYAFSTTIGAAGARQFRQAYSIEIPPRQWRQ